MMSNEQGVAAARAIQQRDDPEAVRQAIFGYAHEYEQFGLSSFIAKLPARPADLMPAWNAQANAQAHERGEAIQRQHEADNAACDVLGAATVDEIGAKLIAEMEPELATVYRRRLPHQWQSIRSAVAEHARVHQMLPVSGGVL